MNEQSLTAQDSPAVICATSLVDALIGSGMRDFVLSPGSRSAPLALAVADRERRGLIRLHVRIDERSAGFFAIGLVRGSGAPVALICTSGSAVANLHPAIVEADYSAVPLVLLTADRPAELRGVGASQTINQIEIFGSSARWFADISAPENGDEAERTNWGELAVRAAATARDQRGPVHLNLAFRPPLVGSVPQPPAGDARPSVAESPVPLSKPASTGAAVAHGLLIVGDLPLSEKSSDALSQEILRLAEVMGWPVIAEPTANLPKHANVLSHGPLIAGCAEFADEHAPDFVLTVGRFGLTRAVGALVSRAKEHWAVSIDGRGEPADPGRSADRVLTDMPVFELPNGGLDREAQSDDGRAKVRVNWLRAWQSTDELVHEAVGRVLDDQESLPTGISGAVAAISVWDGLLESDTVFLASSWPIRFIDLLAGQGRARRVLANRGANGIDGLIATSLGIATSLHPSDPRSASGLGPPGSGRYSVVGTSSEETTVTDLPKRPDAERAVLGQAARTAGARGAMSGDWSRAGEIEDESDGMSDRACAAGVVSLVGDVAFLHDVGSLVGAAELEVNAVFVVLNNNGGGIFSQLEQGAPQYQRDFERVFGTPHGQDLAAISRAFGVPTNQVHDLPELAKGLTEAREAGGVQVIIAQTLDREAEAVLLRQIAKASCAAIRGGNNGSATAVRP